MIPFYVINGLLLGSSLVLLAHSIAVLHGVLHRLYEIQERLRMLDENLDSHDRLEAERFQDLEGGRPEVIRCKDCAYCVADEWEGSLYCPEVYERSVDPEWFCSHAERRPL